MATFIDIHDVPGVKAEAAADAHAADLRVQGRTASTTSATGSTRSRARCSASSRHPTPRRRALVHREAHGLEAQAIHRVREGA